jgi:hypothetical protein
MSADIKPSDMIVGYAHLAAGAAAPVEGIFIPLTSMPGLTAALADPDTGDARQVLYSLSQHLYGNYNALSATTKPSHLTVSRNTPTGIDPNSVRHTYSFVFDLQISGATLSPES